MTKLKIKRIAVWLLTLSMVFSMISVMPAGALASYTNPADIIVQNVALNTAASVRASGTLPGDGTTSGAPWRLYRDGSLVVDAGSINWTGWQSPWHSHRSNILTIEFAHPITGGASLRRLFYRLENVTTINGLEHFNTSNVTDMDSMFRSARSLTDLDLSRWDTRNVTNMNDMFLGASNLTSLNLSGWDTRNVTNMGGMFWNASSLISVGDISGWDTHNVTDMSMMFLNASSLTTLDLSGWDTRNVVDMSDMFSGASSLTSLDLSRWDTRNVTKMNHMGGIFAWAISLRVLTLGVNFRFTACNPNLPPVPYSGMWRNVGTGTVGTPQGGHVLTSAELVNFYRTQGFADTWIRTINFPGVTQPPIPLNAIPFADVNAGNWFAAPVAWAYANNITTGIGGTNNFAPHGSVTRAHFVTFLHRVLGRPAARFGASEFSDVRAGQWYTDAVAWASSVDIAQGSGDRFRPHDDVTRQEMVTFLHRFANHVGADTTASAAAFNEFPDRGLVADWARAAMVWATDNEIITGNLGRLLPRNGATRAEALTIIHRFVELVT